MEETEKVSYSVTNLLQSQKTPHTYTYKHLTTRLAKYYQQRSCCIKNVSENLDSLNEFMSGGTDRIHPWVLKELAVEMTGKY